MEPNHPLGDEREFDRLLRRAEWPEPEAEQIARLEDQWSAVSRRRLRLRVGALAIAASIAVLATVLALRHSTSALQLTATPSSVPEETEIPSGRSEVAHSERPQVEEPRQPVARLSEPRDPTPYERVVFMAAAASRRRQFPAPAQAPPIEQKIVEQKAIKPKTVELQAEPDGLNELIVALAADPAADVDKRLVALQGDFDRHEPELWTVIERAGPERRRAAALILARIGSERSLPVLVALLGDRATHAAAVTGLCRLAGPADLKILVAAEPDGQLRQNLLTALLARRTEESVGMYLELFRGFRADALAASSSMADPPVDSLIAFLESPQQSMRLAAAQTLGSLPQVDIAARMSESVFRGVGRQEALLALLLSPDAESARFLNAARQNVYLMASVYAAEQQLRSLTLAAR